MARSDSVHLLFEVRETPGSTDVPIRRGRGRHKFPYFHFSLCLLPTSGGALMVGPLNLLRVLEDSRKLSRQKIGRQLRSGAASLSIVSAGTVYHSGCGQ
jgi:hypothetical protein